VAVLGGLTIASGLDTQATRADFDRDPTNAQLHASGSRKQDRTNALFATTVGMALATGATALWLIDWDTSAGRRAAALPLIRVGAPSAFSTSALTASGSQ
jgi:hypothetical protein